MGSCQYLCKQQDVQEREATIQLKLKQKHQADKDQKTDLIISSDQFADDKVGEEFNSIREINRFNKKIQAITIQTDRCNRFVRDVELEVKYLIKKNYEEEQENLKRIQQIYEQELQQQRDEMQRKQKKQQEELDNQFSFQNSLKQTSEIINTNPFQPKSTSQFAPKKNDNDSVSQKSQISKTPTPPYKDKSQSSQSDIMRKSALMKIKQFREELASNNASKGSSKKKQQLQAYEKMFSEFFSMEERNSSSCSKTQKSVKSILKHKAKTNRSFSGSKSIKSTNTAMNKSSFQRKVRFSKDTNFNNERKGKEKKRKSFWDW